jgi:predicted transposase/invertase (TIGR01784 family)
MSEVMDLGPRISRLDFVAEAQNDKKKITLIRECQTNLPTDDDVKRFFQYVSSIRMFKENHVELYILCTEKPSYNEREFVINESCVYTMHVISLKDFKARDIFKSIENKLKNNEEITDEDIASLQLIVYTDFDESKLEILNNARKLLEKISERLIFDINEKKAIVKLFNVLSVNMLDSHEHEQYVEENNMLIDPVERYFKNKGIEEGMEKGMEKGREEGKEENKLEIAKNLLQMGFSIDEIVKITGISKKKILDAK